MKKYVTYVVSTAIALIGVLYLLFWGIWLLGDNVWLSFSAYPYVELAIIVVVIGISAIVSGLHFPIRPAWQDARRIMSDNAYTGL